MTTIGKAQRTFVSNTARKIHAHTTTAALAHTLDRHAFDLGRPPRVPYSPRPRASTTPRRAAHAPREPALFFLRRGVSQLSFSTPLSAAPRVDRTPAAAAATPVLDPWATGWRGVDSARENRGQAPKIQIRIKPGGGGAGRAAPSLFCQDCSRSPGVVGGEILLPLAHLFGL